MTLLTNLQFSNEMNLEASVGFVHQLTLIDESNNSKSNVEAYSVTKSLIKYKYCDKTRKKHKQVSDTKKT